jgi:GNAT superfamily N-acetyltransferase
MINPQPSVPLPADDIAYRKATGDDRGHILALRRAVYVDADRRIASADDFSFDRYDDRATYFLAMGPDGPLGTVKTIVDSEIGLPVDEVADLSAVRPGKILVEWGHLMTLPRVRAQGVGLMLMREALAYCVNEVGATHVIGDVFIDKSENGYIARFYRAFGFVDLHGPYRDPRFIDAPESMIMICDLAATIRNLRQASGQIRELFDKLFSKVSREAAVWKASNDR